MEAEGQGPATSTLQAAPLDAAVLGWGGMEVCAVMISKPQSCLTMCVQGKPQNWCLLRGAKPKTKNMGKDPSPKAKRKYFPLFQKQGPVAGDPAAAGRCLQRELSQKKANTEKAVASAGTGDR